MAKRSWTSSFHQQCSGEVLRELRIQFDACSKKIDAVWGQISGILGQVADRVAVSGGFGPCLLLNEQMGALMEEKKGYAAAFDHMVSEHRNVTDYIERLFDRRDELNQEIQAKRAGPLHQCLQETCGKNMLDVCYVHTSYDEYIAMVKTGNECR